MARIEDIFSREEVLDYVRERKQPVMLGDVLFPEDKIDDIEFDMITGANNLPVSASVHAFDTETELASREAIKKGVASLALIKRKIRLSEKEIIKITTPRTRIEEKQAINKVYNDIDKMVEGVKVRVEAMRFEALSTGQIKINENNIAVTLDYGIPNENKKAFTWSSASAKPLDDIAALCDAVETSGGSRPTRILTSRKILNSILANSSVREAIHGVNAKRVVTKQQLNDLLVSMDLPVIGVYEAKYKVQKANGTYDTKRYLAENKLVVIPDGDLGQTIYGLTAEEIEFRSEGNIDISKFGNIVAEVYKTPDPVARFTKAVATALPTLPTALEIGYADITL